MVTSSKINDVVKFFLPTSSISVKVCVNQISGLLDLLVYLTFKLKSMKNHLNDFFFNCTSYKLIKNVIFCVV